MLTLAVHANHPSLRVVIEVGHGSDEGMDSVVVNCVVVVVIAGKAGSTSGRH
jgi:hypothetical protein